MATVNRPPFWIPRPADDTYWSPPAPVKSPIIAFLTKQKVFGAGGQVPPFRPNFTYDDPPIWQGSPLNSGAVQVTKTQVKIFGQPGQVPTKRWLPYLTYDDAPMWQGAPLNSGAIMATKTQVKVFGQPGQVPPFRPNFTYDDASPWQWPLYERNRNVLFVLTEPFSNRQWQWQWYDDASGWSGGPIGSAAIQSLTQQKVFGAGGQVPRFRPNFTYDDASGWCGTPIKSAPLQLLTPQKLFGQGGQVVPFRWNATYDDASYWSGAPINSAAIQLLTPQRVFGQGGQVPPYRWNYTIDDPASWRATTQRNTSLLSVKQNPFSNRQWQWSDDPPQWQGSPVSSAVIPLTAFILYVPAPAPWMDEDDSAPWRPTLRQNFSLFGATAQNPFSNRQWQWSDDASGWQGAPIDAAPIQLLTQQKFFGAGGQVPPFRWNWGYDDPPSWPGGEPINSAPLQLLTAQKIFGAGGQVPPYRWNYTIDDPPSWQWTMAERNPNLLQPSAEPFSNRQTYWYSEDSFWQGSPLSSRAINVTSTQATFYGQPGQVPPFRANFTYDDASPWQWPLYERNRNVLAPSGQPFSNRQWQWSDDAASWQGTPLSSVTITLTSFSLYKPGVAFPAPPDDHSTWLAEPLGRNPNVLVPVVPNPFSNRQTYWYSEDAFWQGAPLASVTIQLPVTEPFSNRQTYWYSEDAWWNAKPAASAAISLLTPQKVYGQGGQVPPFRPNFTLDDPPMWPGPVPRGSAVIQLPATTSFYGKPGQVVPFRWNYTYDLDAAYWSGAPRPGYTLIVPSPPVKPSGIDWIDFRRRARRR